MLFRFVLAAILTGMFLPVGGLGLQVGLQEGARVKISGTVSVFSGRPGYAVDPPPRLAGAKIVVEDSNGSTIETVTDSIGQYSATLTPDRNYTISVTKSGFCPVHRPAFGLSPGSTAEFDFTITNLCPGDGVWPTTERDAAGTPDAYFNSTIPHYFEESFFLGKSQDRKLIIAFGMRTKRDALIEYSALPSREHPEFRMPVTISFNTFTIKADRALFDRQTRLLRAVGHVSVEDGTDSPPHTASCVALELNDTEPQLRPCKPASKQGTSQ